MITRETLTFVGIEAGARVTVTTRSGARTTGPLRIARNGDPITALVVGATLIPIDAVDMITKEPNQ